MNNKNLVMPANYAVMTEEEMTYTTGGGILSQLFSALAQIFNVNVRKKQYSQDVMSYEEAHGAVTAVNGNIYTYSDGFKYTSVNGESTDVSYNTGNFFSGLSSIFRIFGA